MRTSPKRPRPPAPDAAPQSPAHDAAPARPWDHASHAVDRRAADAAMPMSRSASTNDPLTSRSSGQPCRGTCATARRRIGQGGSHNTLANATICRHACHAPATQGVSVATAQSRCFRKNPSCTKRPRHRSTTHASAHTAAGTRRRLIGTRPSTPWPARYASPTCPVSTHHRNRASTALFGSSQFRGWLATENSHPEDALADRPR